MLDHGVSVSAGLVLMGILFMLGQFMHYRRAQKTLITILMATLACSCRL